MKKRVAITTLGCKANQYDGAVLAALCQQAGYQVLPFDAEADAYIVNSCTVTASADAQSRQLLRKARRRKPDALCVATGCYAEVAMDEVRAQDVDLVVGKDHKLQLIELLQQRWQEGAWRDVEAMPRQRDWALPRGVQLGARSRPFLKIQDGCDLYCTYCIIPKARGAQRSMPVAEVIAQLAAYAEQGFDEVVLTGIHIGTYGRDLSPQCSLTDLLRMIVKRKPIRSVRVSSIDPHEVTDEMIELFASSDTLCPHLHVPIQSGSDRVLKRMARLYRRKDIDRVLERLATRVPHVAVGTDMIVGFHDETEEDFTQTVELMRTSALSYAHVFPYSQRKGTTALRMPKAWEVPEDIRNTRCASLRAMADQQQREFYRAHVGMEFSAIAEGRRDRATGLWKAITSNYIPVLVQSPSPRARGGASPLRVTDVTGTEVFGQWT